MLAIVYYIFHIVKFILHKGEEISALGSKENLIR